MRVMCKPGSVGDLGGQPPRSTRPAKASSVRPTVNRKQGLTPRSLRGEAQRFQDVVQAQPLPELQTDVHVTGGPGLFVGHAIDVYRNQIARGGGGVDVHGGSGLHGEDVPELPEFRILIGHSRERQLTGERVLEFSGQREPLLGWSWREITERTDYLLSWSLVGEDGLDQKEIHIGFIFVSADGFADVHGHYK